MSKIYYSVLFLILSCPVLFSQVTLSHNVGETITVTDIHSCSWGDVYWARTFILEDFGISPASGFTITSGRVAINPQWTAWDSNIQFNIYSIDDKFPEIFNTEDLLGSSQIEDVWMIQGPYFTMNFETPVVVPPGVERILVEVHQLPSLNSSAHLFCSGTAEDNDISWFKTANAGCFPFVYTNTADIGHPNARFYITITTSAIAMGNDDPTHSNVKIYPNPAREMLTVEGGNFKSYTLANTLGQVVSKGLPGSGISLQNLNAGIYTLVLEDADGKTSSHKIIRE